MLNMKVLLFQETQQVVKVHYARCFTVTVHSSQKTTQWFAICLFSFYITMVVITLLYACLRCPSIINNISIVWNTALYTALVAATIFSGL
jgi:hypothetical protein